ncbi:MAG: hypothetical protein AB7O38_31395, partial [Pirellulaceae bacterium]
MTQDQPRFRVGVIASMKRGLEQFIQRELVHLEQAGAEISLFPTKYGRGLYAPPPHWTLVRWTVWRILVAQFVVAVRHPVRYVRTLADAAAHRALVEFLIAVYFTTQMHS